MNTAASSGPSPGTYCVLGEDYNIHSGPSQSFTPTVDVCDHYDELSIYSTDAGPTTVVTTDNAHAHMSAVGNAPAHPTVISHDEYDHIPSICSLSPQQSVVSENEYDEIPGSPSTAGSLQLLINNCRPQFIVREANARQDDVVTIRPKPALAADVNVYPTESIYHTGYCTACTAGTSSPAHIMYDSDEYACADDSADEGILCQFAEQENPSKLSNFDRAYETCAAASGLMEQAGVVHIHNQDSQVAAARLISNAAKVIVVDNEVYDRTPEPAASPWQQPDEEPWVKQTKPLMVIIADNDLYERTPEPTDTRCCHMHDTVDSSGQQCHIGQRADGNQSRGHPNLRVYLPTRTAMDRHDEEFAGSPLESVDDPQYNCANPTKGKGYVKYPEAVDGSYEELPVSATDWQPMVVSDDDEFSQTSSVDSVIVQPAMIVPEDPVYDIPRKHTKTVL